MSPLESIRDWKSASKPRVLALADDLTGALEVGAKFAEQGLKTIVTTNRQGSAMSDFDVLVIDTETRHVDKEEAFQIVREIASAAPFASSALVYKKTDSTLRGNIAHEFRALQNVFPDRMLIYAPAYAEMGRTVRNGKLYLWGTLLHETEFARDLLNPIRESDIQAMLKCENVIVLDGESSHDADDAARSIMTADSPSLAAGPAALAGALARICGTGPRPLTELPRLVRCLVVNGSVHSASLKQISSAQAEGCFERWAWLTDEPAGAGLRRARSVGEQVRQRIAGGEFEGLIVFGGDTAFAIHAALGSPDFTPCGEILPGVPLSRCGNLVWVTKAGGFGQPDTLCRIQNLLFPKLL